MTSITPCLSLAAHSATTSAFTSKPKQLSISSKPAALVRCSRNGLKLHEREGCLNVKRSNGGGLFVFACSTTPYVRRVGSQRLSCGNKTGGGAAQVATKDDVSQALSAMLPFVVAVTAVAALAQPATFTW